MATSEHPLYEPKDTDAAPGRLLLWITVALGLILWTAALYAGVRFLLL